MNDLVEWLKAQLDDDEAYARNAFGDHNEAVPEWTEIWSGAVQIGPHEDLLLTGDSQVSRHIARFDPARVLRDVEAKRKILDWHSPVRYELIPVAQCEYCAGLCHSQSGLGCDSPDAPYPCDTIRLLALPYCDRPGYQEAWRP